MHLDIESMKNCSYKFVHNYNDKNKISEKFLKREFNLPYCMTGNLHDINNNFMTKFHKGFISLRHGGWYARYLIWNLSRNPGKKTMDWYETHFLMEKCVGEDKIQTRTVSVMRTQVLPGIKLE